MPRTQLTGEQVNDESITRDDLNVSTPGQAVVRKIVPGVGITITENGVDEGTGDVTINADPVAQVDAVQRIQATIEGKIKAGGSEYFTHDGQIAHSDVPIVLEVAYELQTAAIAVDKVDSGNDYAVNIYDEAGPTLVSTLVTLNSGNLTASVTGLTVSLPIGNYGVRIERTAGSGKSDFKNTVISFLIVKV